MATINIYQSSYIQQSGHRRRTWQVKKKKKCLCFARPCRCARNKQIVMTLRTSLLTPPDTSSEQQFSHQKRSITEQGMISGSSAPPNTTHLSPPPTLARVRAPLRSHDKNASPSQQRVAAGHMNRQQDNRLHFTGTLAGHHLGANLSGTWSVLVHACVWVCVCSMCRCAHMQVVCLCAMPPLWLNTLVRLESADGV